jgi:hypothetical protein
MNGENGEKFSARRVSPYLTILGHNVENDGETECALAISAACFALTAHN